jgi:hypothetical protein
MMSRERNNVDWLYCNNYLDSYIELLFVINADHHKDMWWIENWK